MQLYYVCLKKIFIFCADDPQNELKFFKDFMYLILFLIVNLFGQLDLSVYILEHDTIYKAVVTAFTKVVMNFIVPYLIC